MSSPRYDFSQAFSPLAYINFEAVSARMLRDWDDMLYRLDAIGAELEEIDARLTSITPNYDGLGVSGGALNRQEDKLIDAIDKKDILLSGRERAKEYFAFLLPAIKQLSEDERYIIQNKYIPGDRGVETVMEHFCVSRAVAYKKSRDALKHLSDLLFK